MDTPYIKFIHFAALLLEQYQTKRVKDFSSSLEVEEDKLYHIHYHFKKREKTTKMEI
jgi:hypothetical protein